MTVHIKASQGNGSLQVSCVALSGEEFLTVEVEMRDEIAHLESRIRCRLDWEMIDFFEDTVILNKDRLLKDYEQLTVKEIQDKDKSNVLQLLRTFRKAVQVPANLLTSSKPLKVRVHFANALFHLCAGVLA